MWKVKKVETYPKEWKIYIPKTQDNPGHEDNLSSSFFYTEKEARLECHNRNQDDF